MLILARDKGLQAPTEFSNRFCCPPIARVDRAAQSVDVPPAILSPTVVVQAVLVDLSYTSRPYTLPIAVAFDSHAMARFTFRHRKRLSLVSKIVPDTNLFDPPPKRPAKKAGRPQVKGESLPSPQEVVASKKRGK